MLATISLGYSLVETMFVCALAATLAGIAAPGLLVALDDYRTAGAARYLAGRLQALRIEAAMRSADVGLRFVATGQTFLFTPFADGNGNGVRALDINHAVDRPIAAAEQLADRFPGVDFGTLPGLPGVDGGAPPGTDPIKLGSSNILSFSPSGTSSSGSLYIKGQRAQYVVRIYGETGKIRLLKFLAGANQWSQQ
jgi:hypothetical protein